MDFGGVPLKDTISTVEDDAKASPRVVGLTLSADEPTLGNDASSDASGVQNVGVPLE